MSVLLDCLHVVEVDLVAEHQHLGQLAALERLLNEFDPVFEVLEALLVRDVVYKHHLEQMLTIAVVAYRIRFVNVGANHFREYGLTTDVPNLECHLNFFWHF